MWLLSVSKLKKKNPEIHLFGCVAVFFSVWGYGLNITLTSVYVLQTPFSEETNIILVVRRRNFAGSITSFLWL